MIKQDNWRHQSPETALTLPSRYFYDPEHFRLERDRIFYGAWHVIGHKNELSEPGRFIVRDLFDQSIVAACDRNGRVHAFHNVCQHRGTRLLNENRGVQKGVFRCPYHSWCYRWDGSLAGAPRSNNLVDFQLDRYNIPKVRVEEFGGFLYFNMDPNARSMSDLFPGAEEQIEDAFPLMNDMRLVEEKDVIVPANWKVIMDNSIEGYHFELSGPCHTDLAALIDFKTYTLTQHDHWWTYVGKSDPRTTEAYGVDLGGTVDEKDCFFNIGLWPHNTFYTFPFSKLLGTFLIYPLTPESSLLRFGYYTPYKELPAVSEACMSWMNDKLGPEDIKLNEAVQKGLRSFGYEQGRYMIDEQRSNESEHLVHHFHTLVYDAVHG